MPKLLGGPKARSKVVDVQRMNRAINTYILKIGKSKQNTDMTKIPELFF